MFDRLGRRDDETPFVVQWFVQQGIEVWSTKEGKQRFDSLSFCMRSILIAIPLYVNCSQLCTRSNLKRLRNRNCFLLNRSRGPSFFVLFSFLSGIWPGLFAWGVKGQEPFGKERVICIMRMLPGSL